MVVIILIAANVMIVKRFLPLELGESFLIITIFNNKILAEFIYIHLTQAEFEFAPAG